MAEEAQIAEQKKETSRNYPDLIRIKFKLKLPSEVVDLFHSGAGGYRAQFYHGIECGECANRWAVDACLKALRNLFAGEQRPRFDWELAEASLMDRGAKLWIHQGTWFRQACKCIRNLEVERWARNAEGETLLRHRRIPIWARLVPANEHRIHLIGGWLQNDLTSAGVQMKPYRSCELQMLGFT
jgi:hypothetical protein